MNVPIRETKCRLGSGYIMAWAREWGKEQQLKSYNYTATTAKFRTFEIAKSNFITSK